MNWIDWNIVVFLAIAVIAGFKSGFVRLSIGLVALIVGFVGASWFHGLAADPLMPWLKVQAVANLAGFCLIFFGTLTLGAIIADGIARMLKIVGLSFVDRTLGAAFGVVRGALVLVIVTMVVMAFAPRRLPAAVDNSLLAPYAIRGAQVLSQATPNDIKAGVERTLSEAQAIIRNHRVPKKLDARQE